ncbi:hypothetical protein ACTFIW_005427 [Dictyostelium discoideum]
MYHIESHEARLAVGIGSSKLMSRSHWKVEKSPVSNVVEFGLVLTLPIVWSILLGMFPVLEGTCDNDDEELVLGSSDTKLLVYVLGTSVLYKPSHSTRPAIAKIMTGIDKLRPSSTKYQ